LALVSNASNWPWPTVNFPLGGTVQEIVSAFTAAGIGELPAVCYEQFHTYLGLLLRWNARLNLTAIRTPEQIIRRHFVECAFAARHLPADIENILDYGSGAGLPGIPFAICRPEIRVTLAESQGKKAAFLREAVRLVGTGTEVFDGRVETMPSGRMFHAVSMRAVEKMELAIPIALHRVQRYLVLLTTERSAPAYLELVPELRWANPMALPNSDQMILALGRRAG
jgi:16S rRNA (guanine527-N7)-methyltransferase